jgi:hypothetical protein
VEAFCEHRNGPLGFIKGREFLAQLSSKKANGPFVPLLVIYMLERTNTTIMRLLKLKSKIIILLYLNILLH